MGSLDTKLLIAETFITLAEKEPIDKISVSDIIAASEKNRKTFYYHFCDKDYLINWIFRYDLAKILNRQMKPEELLYRKEEDESLASFPYYVRIKDGFCSLNNSPFFHAFAECLENRRLYYMKVFTDSSPRCLRNYLYELYVPALYDDVVFMLNNRYLPKSNIKFLAEFYTNAVVNYYIKRCSDKSIERILEGLGPFRNIIHSSLRSQIDEQQLHRAL
jgi:AcrR family transcriptional regulator